MILEILDDPVEGLVGPDFYAYFLNQKNLFEFNDQQVLDAVQDFIEIYIGRGVVYNSWTGDLISDGGGLTVEIAAHTSFIKWPVKLEGITEWVMTDDDTRYLWELQNNTDDAPNYVITDDLTDPSTDDTPAHILASITTAAGAITDITNLYRIIYPVGYFLPEISEVFGFGYSGLHAKTWDADTDTRTGGTAADDIEVAADVNEAQPITVKRGAGEDVILAPTKGYTFTPPRTFSIVDGKKPIYDATDTNRQEDITINYTPL